MRKPYLFLIVIAAMLCGCNDEVIFSNDEFEWKRGSISLNDGSITAYAPDSKTIISNYPDAEFETGKWTLTRDISHLPQYSAPTSLEEALYNLSLEESVIAVEPDSTMRTGKNWSGVWTRDISYSILLSLSHVQTNASINSLIRKVDRLGRIIQDTGTGGSWPCSTDRSIWAVAAYEIYKVTGDEEWLQYIYPIIRRCVETDLQVAWNPETGMFKGESSYLDWREQEYPRWMNPVDIYMSENLGTECVHYQALKILSRISDHFGDKEDAARYSRIADGVAEGINKYLWMPDKSYYGQFLYGRQKLILSPRSETLGEALAVLYGIASEEQASLICSSVPEHSFGTACFYPCIKDIPPYHNDSMWPFVQAWWMDACKKAGNETAVLKAIASIYRLAAFCLTNKENMVLHNGKWQGTAINSSRQLWSIAGNLNIVYSVLFGIEFEECGLRFNPFVPKALSGERKLSHFRYRGSLLNMEVSGYGDGIKSFTFDGVAHEPFVFAEELEGEHTIRIVLNGHSSGGSINIQPVAYSPLTPVCTIDGDVLSWAEDTSANVLEYRIIRNGEPYATVGENRFKLRDKGEYQVVAVGENGLESFASEPLTYNEDVTIVEMENFAEPSVAPYLGYGGKGYVELTLDKNRSIEFAVEIDTEGEYELCFRYGNANGPVYTENKCALRELYMDNNRLGSVVMPHCGTDAYDCWRYSNSIKTHLSIGKHIFRLCLEDIDTNMNIDTNSCAVDAMLFSILTLQ